MTGMVLLWLAGMVVGGREVVGAVLAERREARR